jgi:hypothetical protein
MRSNVLSFVKLGIQNRESVLTSPNYSPGIDALGEVTVRLQDPKSGRIFSGRAANTDVVYASAIAYVNALNRLLLHRDDLTPKLHPQLTMAAKAV